MHVYTSMKFCCSTHWCLTMGNVYQFTCLITLCRLWNVSWIYFVTHYKIWYKLCRSWNVSWVYIVDLPFSLTTIFCPITVAKVRTKCMFTHQGSSAALHTGGPWCWLRPSDTSSPSHPHHNRPFAQQRQH